MVIYGADGLTKREQAHALLSLAVKETWGWAVLPPLQTGEHGKPFFTGRPDRCFNLSHSGSLVLCALDERPVGVDIQVVKPFRPGLPRRVCSDGELAWIGEGEDRWGRFALLWALKECRVKYTGEGLTRPIPGIAVPLPGEGEGPLELDGLHFRTWSGPGWRAAACGESVPPVEINWRTRIQ